MKPQKPSGLKIETPPKLRIPDAPKPPQDPSEKPALDETHPRLANLLHYAVIGVFFVIIFLGGSLLMMARGLSSPLSILVLGFIGGVGAIFKVLNLFSRKNN